MAVKCCTKLETAKEGCPIVFQGHPSNFKVTQYKISPILTQTGRFRTIGRSQLSNPSDLPCFNRMFVVIYLFILFVYLFIYFCYKSAPWNTNYFVYYGREKQLNSQFICAIISKGWICWPLSKPHSTVTFGMVNSFTGLLHLYFSLWNMHFGTGAFWFCKFLEKKNHTVLHLIHMAHTTDVC